MNRINEPVVKKIDRGVSPMLLVEHIGRTCYKSQSEYTDETAQKFVKMLIDNKHFAMLEHAIFVFSVEKDYFQRLTESMLDRVDGLNDLKYFNVTQTAKRILISGSARAFGESLNPFILGMACLLPTDVFTAFFSHTELITKGIDDETTVYISNMVKYVPDLKLLPELTREEIEAHSYMSLHITCDRGISHELVRHRNCAFAQESTRYCNYTSQKFGGELTFVRPPEEFFKQGVNYWDKYLNVLDTAEKFYNLVVSKGVPPECARYALPHALKTEICVTANVKEWKHIIDLRYHETTGKAHPSMKIVAGKAKKFLDEDLLSF